jgi:serine protease AprX
MRRIAVIAVLVGSTAVSIGLPPASAAAGDRTGVIRADLASEMRGRSDDHELDVVVSFAGVASNEGAARAREAVGSFPTAYSYRTISAVAAELSVGQIRALAALPEVADIQLDAPVELMLDSATRDFGTDKANLDFAVDGNNESGACPGTKSYCADDVVIAVLDSGIWNGHADLDAGKVIKYADCTLDPCAPGGADMDGHGTHVASIAAGEGEANPANAGVAPGAALVSVKVAGSFSTVSWMDRGIEWVLQNQAAYGIDVLNLSAGTGGSSDGTDTTSRLINRAAAAGIVPVVAAGNSGNKPQTIGAPAAAKNAITVGAMNDSGGSQTYDPVGWNLWITSGRGPTLDGRIKPDVVAPGVKIEAAGGSSSTAYTTKTGTSMSSPFVAGVAALMLDADPTLRPSGTACAVEDTSTDCADGVLDASMSMRLKDLVTGTASDWGPAGPDNHFGAGRLDAYAAVDAASALAAKDAPPAPAHLFASGSLSGTGAVVEHAVPVSATDWPISVTMITPTAVSCGSGCVTPDFEVTLLDPSGVRVASAPVTHLWQENLGFTPTVTGTYLVRVRSLEGAGPYWVDVAYPGGTAAPPPSLPPAAPANLVAAPVSGSISQIDLSWGNVAGESGYKVERSPDGVSGWTQIATPSADVTAFRDSGLATATTYYYRVRAYNSAGDSAYSNTASARTNADTIAPTVPTNVKAAGSRGKISLSWTASTDSGGSGLAGYKVFRSTSSTGTFTQIATTTTTSYTDTAVTKGKVYYYYVVAYDKAGNNSAASAKVSGKAG